MNLNLLVTFLLIGIYIFIFSFNKLFSSQEIEGLFFVLIRYYSSQEIKGYFFFSCNKIFCSINLNVFFCPIFFSNLTLNYTNCKETNINS